MWEIEKCMHVNHIHSLIKGYYSHTCLRQESTMVSVVIVQELVELPGFEGCTIHFLLQPTAVRSVTVSSERYFVMKEILPHQQEICFSNAIY